MKYKNIFVIVIFSIVALAFIVWYLSQNNQKSQEESFINSETGIKYIAIGDSYTIGLGVDEESRWPNILTNHLRKEGISMNLVANPAVSGYTVRDAIELELPIVEKIKPDLVTVLIGANDNFSQRKVDIYYQELRELLDKLQPMLTNPKNIVLVTLPDYTKSPAIQEYQREDVLKLIEEYNRVIKKEADKRGLKVADIFPISQTMTKSEDYVSDGLHPSAKSYAKWEQVIFTVMRDLLRVSVWTVTVLVVGRSA